MTTVQVRYIVNDIDAAIAFYCQHLGFSEVMHPAPMFAMLSRGELRRVLSQPGGQILGGGSTLADGRKPQPGGWNHFAVEVTDLAETVERLRSAGLCAFGATSSRVSVATKPWSRIPPAIRSSCSSRCESKRGWRLPAEVAAPCLISSVQEDIPDDPGHRHGSRAVHG